MASIKLNGKTLEINSAAKTKPRLHGWKFPFLGTTYF